MKNVFVKWNNGERTGLIVVPNNASKVEDFIAALRAMNVAGEVVESGKVKFEDLPQDVQEKAKGTLKVFHEVNVVYEYNRFNVSAGCGIYSNYANDHCVAGRYYDKDIFTKEEMAANLAELNSYEFPEWAW